MNLVYIGDKFYSKSGTMMSSIYKVDESGNIVGRCDWGFVQIALRNGEEVHITQANTSQMLWAYKKLESYSEK